MKKLIIFLILLVPLVPLVAQGGIVNNSGTTAEDSLCIVLHLLDADGVPTAFGADDWGYLMVFYPSGDSCFADTFDIDQADANIEIWTTAEFPDYVATYKNTIAALDGAAPREGTYKYIALLRDSSAALTMPITGEFQLYSNGTAANWSDKVDSSGLAPLTSYDPPTNTEMNNRTLATADYFIFGSDQVIVTTNNDKTDYNIASIDPDAINAPAFADNAQYLNYGGAVWVDENNGAAGSTVGTHGLPSNPTTTIASAKTIADAIGTKQINLLQASTLTLAATMEYYHFLGIGDISNNIIDLGGQDVDHSLFENMGLTGIQGGTNLMCAFRVGLTSIDSLEVHAMDCSIVGTMSLKGAGNNTSYFDNCFSSVPGNNTPILIFETNGDATDAVNFRHYSGGLELQGMDANDLISYESDGQLVINANCNASATITARGMMTITNNSSASPTYAATAQYAIDSTMNALADANKPNLRATGFAVAGDAMTLQGDSLETLDFRMRNLFTLIESQRDAHAGQGAIFYVDPANGGTHAGGNRGGIDDPYSTVQDCHDNAITSGNHDIIILVAGTTPGVTTLTEDVTLSKNYMFIRGPGRDFIWTRAGAGNTIEITADGVELSGFQLETAVTGSGDGISITDADFLRVHNVWINDTRGEGVNLLRASNCLILNNTFFETGQSGSGDGIDIVGTAGSSNNNRIKGNVFWDCVGDAIQISGGTTNNTSIINNVIEGSTAYGVDIGASSIETLVAGNYFGNNSSGSINDGGTTTTTLNNEQWSTADSVHVSIEDANKANFKATSVGLTQAAEDNIADTLRDVMGDTITVFKDSVLVAILDANKTNFQGGSLDADTLRDIVGDSTTVWKDSVLTAILDANKVNFKATSTGLTQAAQDAIADTVRDIVGDSLTALATIDELGSAISDSTRDVVGDSTTVWKDSVLTAITDANKVNFKSSGSLNADTIRDIFGDSLANIATIDELADTTRDILGDTLTGPIDSLLVAIEDANKVNFQGGGGISPDTIRDILGDTLTSFIVTVEDSLANQEWAATGASVMGASSTDTVFVVDVDRNTLANVSVTVTQGAVSTTAGSDENGHAIFGLTAGDWVWSASSPPNTGNSGTLTAGGVPDTAVITLFTVSAPSDTNLCTLYGWERIAADTLVGATITIILENVDHDTLLFVNDMGQGTGPRQTRTDSDGYWSMTVIPNTIIDANSYYHYSRTYGAFKKSFYFVVPDSSTINIADCEKRVQ